MKLFQIFKRKPGACRLDSNGRHALVRFLQDRIDPAYKQLDTQGPFRLGENAYDLMYCHEEIFDYAWRALKGGCVDSRHNFVNRKSSALTAGFAACLRHIAGRYPDMRKFCADMASAIEVLLNLDAAAQ